VTLIDARTRGLVRIPGGSFTMGSDHHYPEEAPAHAVEVGPYRISAHPVTNDEYAAFVAATGYVTLAQRPPDPADYPDADPSLLVAGSSVFVPPTRRVSLNDAYQWWQWLPGADWRHPDGPQSTLDCLGSHPVLHLAFADALAYSHWAGLRLPTEAEWEFAARGGLDGAVFAWGDEHFPGGQPMANTWQGEFPWQNLKLDGFEGTAPVGSFLPNGYGLYDMTGNVWEWTSDWYTTRHPDAVSSPCCVPHNPRVTSPDDSHLLGQPGEQFPRRVIKGGSHLCAPNYCLRYRPAARQAQMIDTSMAHLGFRCVVRTTAPANEGETT
jgi:formylglycine-generating enzyme required for sulfatase activity